MEYVHENASIAYSPFNTSEFNALSQIAADGLIPGVPSITVPPNVRIPFRDYIGSVRFDWAQSQKSQWFLRTSADSYLTHNALVQQGALPSTGLTTHNNYWNTVISNQYTFSPSWLGSLVLDASLLHLTQTRNSNIGRALAFPFTFTSQTVSSIETVGDNQFQTPITFFPALRNQEKYQFRYDVSHVAGRHSPKFGVNFIHEPVLSGAYAATAEAQTTFVFNPADYLYPLVVPRGLAQFTDDLNCNTTATPNTVCRSSLAGDGSFSQNVQRLALYAEDSWQVTPHLTVNYGLRYQTTFGLFSASGRSQTQNPAYSALQALGILKGVPHDYRKQFGPRLGIVYAPGGSEHTVIRAAFGMFYNDLAQNGWGSAFQAVNKTNFATGPCSFQQDPNTKVYSLSGSCGGGGVIAPNYKTPYAIHSSAGVQHAFNEHWMMSADYTHEQGNHGYRPYNYSGGINLFTPLIPTTDPNYATDQLSVVPNVTVFHSDNRSTFDALMFHVQGNVNRRFNLVGNYTLAKAQTWGCILGELFDYVNGVCDPTNPFAKGDYGPTGEDVRHRFVIAGTVFVPGGVELTTLTQGESARPYNITNATNNGRISINGVPEGLDQVRGKAYIQMDLRVSRPIRFGDRWEVRPFAEFFNVFNRNNSGANYVTNITLLPVPGPEAQAGDIHNICTNADCSTFQPIKSINQLRVPAGALGDFFGPGTTVGIPFAAQLGVRVTF